jgi:hypothetical protein
MRGIETFTFYDNIIEKGSNMVKGEAIRPDGAV